MMNTILLLVILALTVANTVHLHLRTRPDARVDDLHTKVSTLRDNLEKFTATVTPEGHTFRVILDNGAVIYEGERGSEARDHFMKHKSLGIAVKLLHNEVVRDWFPR